LGLAVGAQILVAETAHDLEIAVVAADHEQLLEELRRLRQGVERALRDSARYQVVAGALGRRARQERRLDLEESLPAHGVADRLADLVPQDQVALHARPP